MKRLSLIAAALVAFSSLAHAQGTVASQPRADLPTYGANVSTHRVPASELTPGPYAKYLIHLGLSREDALAKAAFIDQGQANAEASVKTTHKTALGMQGVSKAAE